MASIIKLKRSSTSGSIPSGGGLQAGELAINLADKKLFSSTDGTDIITISGDQYNLVTLANTSHNGVTAADLRLTVDNAALSNDVISLIGSGTVGVTRNSNGSITFSATSMAQSFDANTGSATPSSETLNIKSGDSTGVTVTATGSTVTISGTAATATDLGVAKFSSDDFDVASGAVSIKDGSITKAYLANSHFGVSLTDADTVDASFNVSIAEDTLQFDAGEGIDITQVANGAVQIKGEDATTTNKGIASFATADFGVSSGAVSLADSVLKGADTDSGTVTGSGHSININGTANEIETSGSGSTITIGLPDDVTIGNNLTVANTVTTTGNTAVGDNLTVASDLTVSGDAHIDGSLTVEGALTYISTSTVYADDGMFKLGANNVADTIDTGIYAKYVNSGNSAVQYSGYFRDSSDGVFKFYKDLDEEPTSTVDTTTDHGFTLAQLDAVIDGGSF
jgi:hypothetical protein